MIPEKIKIGGIIYPIKFSEIDDLGGMGRFCEKAGYIRVANDMPDDITEETLLHEVIHVLGETTGLKLTEEQVLGLGLGLYAFFKDNDWRISK